MSGPFAECYSPSETIVGVDRFAVADPGGIPAESVAAFSSTDWEEVNSTVQRFLSKLAKEIFRRRPDIRSLAGRTSARSFHLFSYRIFEVPSDHGINPVVVGIDFDPAPDGQGVLVRGDITAEETGTIFYETETGRVANTRSAILASAHDIASDLAARPGIVIDNLAQPSFPPEA